MTPIRGWAPQGQKLVTRAPFGKWRTLTFLAAFRHDRIDAPCVLDGPINGQRASLPGSSSSSYRRCRPGTSSSWIIWAATRAQPFAKPSARPAAKLLFLPPYSPDLNPIEQVFAKLKLLLRKAAERSVDATWRRIGTLLDAFPPQECANYLRNSGYASA